MSTQLPTNAEILHFRLRPQPGAQPYVLSLLRPGKNGWSPAELPRGNGGFVSLLSEL